MNATVLERENMTPTRLLATYINEKGISIKAIAAGTGITEGVLYPSLGSGRGRELRIDEYARICNFLDINPLKFIVIPA